MDKSRQRITFVSDAPATEADDGLGVGAYAAALVEGIESTIAPLTIGVFGTWGTGKTSLLNMIHDRLRAKVPPGQAPPDTPVLYPVFFEAWRYEHDASSVICLLKTIEVTLRECGADASALGILGKIGASLVSAISISAGPLTLDWGKAQETYDRILPVALGKEETYYTVLRCMEEFTGRTDNKPTRRLVILVDDLDRCGPRGLEILEATKTMFHVAGITFIVGLDTAPVQSWLDAKYGGGGTMRAEKYLKKMFAVPFHLPRAGKLSYYKLHNSMRQIVAGNADRKIFLPTETEANIRDLKRIVNQVSLIERISDADHTPDLLVFMVSLHELRPDLLQQLAKCHDKELASKVKEFYERYRQNGGYWDNVAEGVESVTEHFRYWQSYVDPSLGA